MMHDSTAMPSRLATVTVTYHPEVPALEAQLRALPAKSLKVLVDNASGEPVLSRIRRLVDTVPRTMLIECERNEGLAAALNRGVDAICASASEVEEVLFLDQDSVPLKDSVHVLQRALHSLREREERVGCVGPSLLDVDTGLRHGFHQATRWRWKRAYPSDDAYVHCANLNGSGTLVPIKLYRALGGLDASLFIDHVDTEWSFRVAAAGYSLWGVPGAVFEHSMGVSGARFWLLGWRVWPVRSPLRMFFLYRNAVILMRRTYVPRVWKFWAVVKLAVNALVVLILGPQRKTQLERMWSGIRAGLRADPLEGVDR